MTRARPHREQPPDHTSFDCADGEHEKCPGHHWAFSGEGKAIPATDAISGKVIACSCGCHMGGRPWPFEAEGYTPPEQAW